MPIFRCLYKSNNIIAGPKAHYLIAWTVLLLISQLQFTQIVTSVVVYVCHVEVARETSRYPLKPIKYER